MAHRGIPVSLPFLALSGLQAGPCERPSGKELDSHQETLWPHGAVSSEEISAVC